jgi:hypothetical protein
MLVLLICAGNLSFSRSWFDVGHVIGNSLEMRREIQYALSLMRWLELDADRCKSAEDLWASFLFAAQKLGFISVTLTLGDDRRHWQRPGFRQPTQASIQDLQGELAGILELHAPVCERNVPVSGAAATLPLLCDPARCPCVGETRLFEIVTELMAEGWIKTTTRWRRGSAIPLAFSPAPSSPTDCPAGRAPLLSIPLSTTPSNQPVER